MSESEIFVCKQCGKEHEASTQEVGSYMCPNQSKPKGNTKVLDSVSLKYLTKVNSLSETQDPNLILDEGTRYEDNSQEADTEPCADRDACSNGHEANNRSTSAKSK